MIYKTRNLLVLKCSKESLESRVAVCGSCFAYFCYLLLPLVVAVAVDLARLSGGVCPGNSSQHLAAA